MTDESKPGRAVNAAAFAAMEEVLQYAHRFEHREDYLPLEELAFRVQRAAVTAGAEVVSEDEHEAGEAGRKGEA